MPRLLCGEADELVEQRRRGGLPRRLERSHHLVCDARERLREQEGRADDRDVVAPELEEEVAEQQDQRGEQVAKAVGHDRGLEVHVAACSSSMQNPGTYLPAN